MYGRAGLAFAVSALVLVSAASVLGALEGGSLQGRAPSASAPPWPTLSAVPAVYDPAGGYDLWYFLTGATWTYANGTWTNVTSAAGTPTDMEGNVGLVYDARDGYALLFGGAVVTVSPFHERLLADSWEFQDGRWSNITASVTGAPPPGELGLMTYDASGGRVLLFGGAPAGTAGGTNSTWAYSAGAWSNVSVPGPPPLVGGQPEGSAIDALVDDPADGYVLYYDSLGRCPTLCPLQWTYAGGAWTNRTASVTPLPRLSLITLFQFDSAIGKVVAVSGCSSTSAYRCPANQGTFEYSAGAWTYLPAAGGPTVRYDSSGVDDPSDSGVMLVGGCCWADFSGLSLGWQDLWIFSQGAWREGAPWGGGGVSILGNDGTWLGVVLVGAPALALAVRRPGVRRRPPSA